MASEIVATDSEHLDSVNHLIHDQWFDIETITFMNDAQTLQVPFVRPSLDGESNLDRGTFRSRASPNVECVLRIHHVKDWLVKESEYVGSYDFNELRFDAQANRLYITTGVPLTFYADVSTLRVSLLITDQLIQLRR